MWWLIGNDQTAKCMVQDSNPASHENHGALNTLCNTVQSAQRKNVLFLKYPRSGAMIQINLVLSGDSEIPR